MKKEPEKGKMRGEGGGGEHISQSSGPRRELKDLDTTHPHPLLAYKQRTALHRASLKRGRERVLGGLRTLPHGAFYLLAEALLG